MDQNDSEGSPFDPNLNVVTAMDSEKDLLLYTDYNGQDELCPIRGRS